jgi:serine O-acetyltransferase
MSLNEENISLRWFRWAPTESLIASIWMYQRYRDRSGSVAMILRKVARLRHRFWSVVTASDIHPSAKLGAGLRMPHPTGIVIHQDAVIGNDCILMQQVTIGQMAGPGAPVLGANIYVGAGAKILGPVIIGDAVRVGANAVVLDNLPAQCTAVGIPARVVRNRETESE